MCIYIYSWPDLTPSHWTADSSKLNDTNPTIIILLSQYCWNFLDIIYVRVCGLYVRVSVFYQFRQQNVGEDGQHNNNACCDEVTKGSIVNL